PRHVSLSRGTVGLEHGASIKLARIGGEQTAPYHDSVEETQFFSQIGGPVLALRPCGFAPVHPQSGIEGTQRVSPLLEPHTDRSRAPRPAAEIRERRCRIEEDEQRNPLSGDLELPGHLVGQEATQAGSDKEVRAAMLESPYRSNVIGSNLLD